ncbi:MAG: recombinase family protein [Candidatus Amoebophilus sp.]
MFSESISGKDNNRVELMDMFESLRAQDIVVVYKIARIDRSLKGLIRPAAKEEIDKGIRFFRVEIIFL